MEHRLCPREDIGHGSRRHRRDEQGQDRGHRQVEHQHLDHEDQTGDRRLKDPGHGARGTTTDQQHQCLLLHPKQPSEVRANGGPGQHDRRLRSD